METKNIVMIPILKIWPHQDNPRKALGDLEELAESIKQNGILQNLTVVPLVGEISKKVHEDSYRCVIGHRRLAAAKKAGLTEVPCTIVNMTPAEQVRTMLMENMQRSDLTPIEQADGFQMMLDLGVSMDELVAQSGFGKTTIQHRLKLRELDRKTLEDRVAKGATLMDLIKIEQVKDLKLRNGILEAFGTSNFEWKLNQAIHEEKRKSNLPKWIELMETFAEKITEEMARGGRPWRYRRMDDLINDPATYTLPEDRDSKRYGYTTNGGYVNLYWHDESSESAERKEPELTERQQRILEAQNSLVESSSMAYRLRLEFIKKVSLPSKKINEAVAYLIQLITHKDARFNYSYPNDRTVDALFDIESSLGWQATADARSKALLEVSTLGLQQALPKMICCIVGDEPYARYINTYGSNKYTDYKANPALDAYYSFLEEIGYGISDEERLLMSGKHPLLQLAKDDPAPEDAEDEEEDDGYDDDEEGEDE